MPKENISDFNSTWGICGFTSALTHLYDSDIRLKNKIDHSSEHTIRMGLLTEVVTFLKYVTTFRSDLIPGLNKLNKDLKSPSTTLGVNEFIKIAENAVRKQEKIGRSNKYQCALTPEALTLYLQKICGYLGAKLKTGPDPGGRGILGLMDVKGNLLHWVYRDAQGKVYNWGSVIEPHDWNTHHRGLGHDSFHHVGCHISFS